MSRLRCRNVVLHSSICNGETNGIRDHYQGFGGTWDGQGPEAAACDHRANEHSGRRGRDETKSAATTSMIGLDTNILIRFLTQDDPVQAAKATEILEPV